MITASSGFVREHLAWRWLDFNRLDKWPGHNADIRSSASRFGVTSERHGKLVLFYHGDTCIGSQVGMVTSLVSSGAIAIAKDKGITKGILRRAGVPVPAGRAVESSDFLGASSLLRDSPGPWVVKPADAHGGEGITTHVFDKNLEVAWEKAKVALAKPTSRILLEEQIDGVDLRVFVVKGRAVGAAVRLPAFVVGDGRRSLSELIACLREARGLNVYLRSKSIDVSRVILALQEFYSLDQVPRVGKPVFLNATANIHTGGVSIEVTDLVSPDVLELAEAACAAVPGLGVAGVDLLAPSIRDSVGVRVIELNTSANSAVNQYPAFGAGRDVTGAIVAGMFPA